MTTSNQLTIDTNGGRNTFTFNGEDLFVSGQSIQGTQILTAADQSVLLARLFGGVVLKNGDLIESANGLTALDSPFFQVKTEDASIGAIYDVFVGNLNKAGGFSDGGDATIAAVIDFGPRFVGGSERIGFDSLADAQNFVSFLDWAAGLGVLDNMM